MKKSSEIRANARFDLYQNMGALFKLYGVSLLLTVLISFVLQLLVNALSLQEGSLLEELISSLIAFLVAWLLAPYTIGANRQLLEMEQGGTPSYQKAWAWFRQGAWNRNASSLVFIIQAWALALTLASKLFDLFLWPLVFSEPFSSNLLFQDLSIANVLSLPTLASSLVASRGSLLLGLLLQLAVAILVQLVLLLFLFAPYLQAADPLRPPKECLRAGIALAKEHFWPLVGMFFGAEHPNGRLFVGGAHSLPAAGLFACPGRLSLSGGRDRCCAVLPSLFGSKLSLFSSGPSGRKGAAPHLVGSGLILCFFFCNL